MAFAKVSSGQPNEARQPTADVDPRHLERMTPGTIYLSISDRLFLPEEPPRKPDEPRQGEEAKARGWTAGGKRSGSPGNFGSAPVLLKRGAGDSPAAGQEQASRLHHGKDQQLWRRTITPLHHIRWSEGTRFSSIGITPVAAIGGGIVASFPWGKTRKGTSVMVDQGKMCAVP